MTHGHECNTKVAVLFTKLSCSLPNEIEILGLMQLAKELADRLQFFDDTGLSLCQRFAGHAGVLRVLKSIQNTEQAQKITHKQSSRTKLLSHEKSFNQPMAFR